MLITYKDRYFLDRFRCIDTIKKFYAISYFDQGGLRYYKVDRFNYKVIERNMIISEEETK